MGEWQEVRRKDIKKKNEKSPWWDTKGLLWRSYFGRGWQRRKSENFKRGENERKVEISFTMEGARYQMLNESTGEVGVKTSLAWYVSEGSEEGKSYKIGSCLE